MAEHVHVSGLRISSRHQHAVAYFHATQYWETLMAEPESLTTPPPKSAKRHSYFNDALVKG